MLTKRNEKMNLSIRYYPAASDKLYIPSNIVPKNYTKDITETETKSVGKKKTNKMGVL